MIRNATSSDLFTIISEISKRNFNHFKNSRFAGDSCSFCRSKTVEGYINTVSSLILIALSITLCPKCYDYFYKALLEGNGPKNN